MVLERAPKQGLAVKSEGALVVALEVDLTQELIREGLARELVNKVQNMRKAAGLEVTQRVRLTVSGDEEVREAVMEHRDYIRHETLALEVAMVEAPVAEAVEWDLNGRACAIGMMPADVAERP